VSTPLLEVDGLGYRYSGPGARDALADVSFSVEPGEFVCVVGTSGTGKSTLLRCVAGLLEPTSGRIELRGRPVDGVPDGVALVFQDYGRSLFPWLTARQNVALPLERRALPREEREERVVAALAEVGLASELDVYPWQLSGGMQQRVAIARAIAYRPSLLLMDEPFGSVDAQTREDLQDTVLDVWRRHATTILFVTHDIDESVYLGGRVLVLDGHPGRIGAEIVIDLPPRDQIETRRLPRFVELRSAVARRLRRASQDDETTSERRSSPPSAMPKSTR
jgi:NitT/TauT family transport system ATP-binding protein